MEEKLLVISKEDGTEDLMLSIKKTVYELFNEEIQKGYISKEDMLIDVYNEVKKIDITKEWYKNVMVFEGYDNYDNYEEEPKSVKGKKIKQLNIKVINLVTGYEQVITVEYFEEYLGGYKDNGIYIEYSEGELEEEEIESYKEGNYLIVDENITGYIKDTKGQKNVEMLNKYLDNYGVDNYQKTRYIQELMGDEPLEIKGLSKGRKKYYSYGEVKVGLHNLIIDEASKNLNINYERLKKIYEEIVGGYGKYIYTGDVEKEYINVSFQKTEVGGLKKIDVGIYTMGTKLIFSIGEEEGTIDIYTEYSGTMDEEELIVLQQINVSKLQYKINKNGNLTQDSILNMSIRDYVVSETDLLTILGEGAGGNTEGYIQKNYEKEIKGRYIIEELLTNSTNDISYELTKNYKDEELVKILGITKERLVQGEIDYNGNKQHYIKERVRMLLDNEIYSLVVKGELGYEWDKEYKIIWDYKTKEYSIIDIVLGKEYMRVHINKVSVDVKKYNINEEDTKGLKIKDNIPSLITTHNIRKEDVGYKYSIAEVESILSKYIYEDLRSYKYNIDNNIQEIIGTKRNQKPVSEILSILITKLSNVLKIDIGEIGKDIEGFLHTPKDYNLKLLVSSVVQKVINHLSYDNMLNNGCKYSIDTKGGGYIVLSQSGYMVTIQYTKGDKINVEYKKHHVINYKMTNSSILDELNKYPYISNAKIIRGVTIDNIADELVKEFNKGKKIYKDKIKMYYKEINKTLLGTERYSIEESIVNDDKKTIERYFGEDLIDIDKNIDSIIKSGVKNVLRAITLDKYKGDTGIKYDIEYKKSIEGTIIGITIDKKYYIELTRSNYLGGFNTKIKNIDDISSIKKIRFYGRW